MQLQFLGSGSAFTVGGGNFQSNMVLTSSSGRRLMIDCGSDARFAMHELGLVAEDMHDVYISHLHADHVGGLEFLGFTTLFTPDVPKPRLFVNEELVAPLWEHTLRGGMGLTEVGEATLETYFDVHAVNASFEWEGVQFHLVRTEHVLSAVGKMSSFGLLIRLAHRSVFITTDTAFSPSLLSEHYEAADLIFHDCETARFKSGVHAHYTQLQTLPASIRAKTWLYHYQPGRLPDCQSDGFLGFVRRGQSFQL
jgi:ribonuclease BN (tRNA processing enzyme)